MHKLILILTCTILLTSCRKQEAAAPEETSQQQLTKIVKTSYIGNIPYNEIIRVAFDKSGRIIEEGNFGYTRNDNGKITSIREIANGSDTLYTNVHYENEATGRVAYTLRISPAVPNHTYYDSTAYTHDDKNRVTQITNYYLHNGAPVINYFFTFSYDKNGNIRKMSRYVWNMGSPVNCGDWSYTMYDERINPLYSDDEVRIRLNYYLYRMMFNSISPGNVLLTSERMEHRADNRPRQCTIIENGLEDIKITYHYQ